MITIQMSKDDFVYDVQGLCKSFYPDVQIEMVNWDEGNSKGDSEIRICVCMETDYVEVSFEGNGTRVSKRLSITEAGRRAYKNILKKSLYQVLSKATGKKLPWGTLTGVRPTKLLMERLEMGETKEQIAEYMEQHYFCSKDKMDLGYAISEKELRILKEIDHKNGYSLYIGIPFCPTRCAYCSFPSYPMENFGELMDAYLQALYKEMDYVAGKSWKPKLSTIYVGGGTPTTLSTEQLQQLLRKIKQVFSMEHVVEFTVEAGRPDSITKEKLEVMKEEGVTRISINPQTMNDETLEKIGRKHSVEQVKEAYWMARNLGFDNINMDLILGLPGETVKEVEFTLKQIEELDPDSLTVHSLVLKRAARLNVDWVNEENGRKIKGEENPRSVYGVEGDTVSMSGLTERFAKSHGYEPYYMYRQKNATGTDSDSRENIGYSKPGKECIYNILIMEEKQSILALGAGASSKFLLPSGKKLIERVENVKSITDYISRIDEMIARKEQFWQEHKEAFQVCGTEQMHGNGV